MLLVFPLHLLLLVTHEVQVSSRAGQSWKRKQADGTESKVNHLQSDVDKQKSKHSSLETDGTYQKSESLNIANKSYFF